MLGWEYLEKLAKQGVQQLQSTTATPKSIASGERAVMVDGNEYNMFIEIDAKSPVKIIYAEGRHALRHLAHGDLRRRAASERGARVPELPLHREDPAAAGGRGRHALGAPGREGARRTARRSRTSSCCPTIPTAMLPQIADIKKRYTALFGN